MGDKFDRFSGKKKKSGSGKAKLYRAVNFDAVRQRVEERRLAHEREKAEAIRRAATPLHHVDSAEKTSFKKFKLAVDLNEMERRRRRLRVPGALIFWAFVALVGLAAWLRFAGLGEKPLHSDEAVQAWKLGELLEGTGYAYDPADHHGPTLYYFSAFAARLAGVDSFAGLTEPVLLFVPALFGVALTASMLLWRRAGARLGACGAAAAFAAVSPAAVYYARYFIQETILVVCFWSATALAYVLYSKNNYKKPEKIILAVLAGLLFGVAIASKETWILMVQAVIAGVIAGTFAKKFSSGSVRNLMPETQSTEDCCRQDAGNGTQDACPPRDRCVPVKSLAPFCLMLGVAGVTAALFYSSFGENPAGVIEAMTAYAGYFDKAAGGAHDKPFWWYFPLISMFKVGKFLFHSESLTLIAGVVFGGFSLSRGNVLKPRERRLLVFSLVSGAALFFVYSVIGYKTPWLVLGVLPPLWLAAGIGCAGVFSFCLKKNKFRPTTLLLPAVAGVLFCAFQGSAARRLSTEPLACDERNPLAYAHTSADVFRVQTLAGNLASVAKPEDFFILVFAQDDHRWPLPWYFRAWKNGYPAAVPVDVLKAMNAPVIVTDESTEADVAGCLNDRDYISDFFQLRPGVLLTVRLRRDLHERYMNLKTGEKGDE